MALNRVSGGDSIVDMVYIENLLDADDLEQALEVLGGSRDFEDGARLLLDRLKQADRDRVSALLNYDAYNDIRSRLGLDARRLLRDEEVAPSVPDPPDWAELRDLAEKMEKNWVKAFYNRYLPDSRAIPIPVQADFGAVDHPWPGAVAPPRPPESNSVVDVYQQMNGYLLILGSAGSGKTYALLQITAHLLRMLKSDHTLPVPAILDLSDWSRNSPVLADWAVERLNKTYVVDKKAARTWLEADRIVLLLDNLDQVSDADRDACVDAINQFLSDFTPKGLVVCSRDAEYGDLGAKLRLWTAIRLQPLDRQEIAAYLTSAAPNWPSSTPLSPPIWVSWSYVQHRLV